MKVTGVIENMATFICPDCDTPHDLFGSGGGDELAEALETDLLGRIPIDIQLREGSDAGTPLVVGDPDSPAAKVIEQIARTLGERKEAETPSGIVGRKLPLSVG